MAKCSFDIPFSGNAEGLMTKIMSAIEKNGGMFKGDEVSGNFSISVLGTITGSYIIVGQIMKVDILSSPIFIPCSQIESFMKNQLGK